MPSVERRGATCKITRTMHFLFLPEWIFEVSRICLIAKKCRQEEMLRRQLSGRGTQCCTQQCILTVTTTPSPTHFCFPQMFWISPPSATHLQQVIKCFYFQPLFLFSQKKLFAKDIHILKRIFCMNLFFIICNCFWHLEKTFCSCMISFILFPYNLACKPNAQSMITSLQSNAFLFICISKLHKFWICLSSFVHDHCRWIRGRISTRAALRSYLYAKTILAFTSALLLPPCLLWKSKDFTAKTRHRTYFIQKPLNFDMVRCLNPQTDLIGGDLLKFIGEEKLSKVSKTESGTLYASRSSVVHFYACPFLSVRPRINWLIMKNKTEKKKKWATDVTLTGGLWDWISEGRGNIAWTALHFKVQLRQAMGRFWSAGCFFTACSSKYWEGVGWGGVGWGEGGLMTASDVLYVRLSFCVENKVVLWCNFALEQNSNIDFKSATLFQCCQHEGKAGSRKWGHDRHVFVTWRPSWQVGGRDQVHGQGDQAAI